MVYMECIVKVLSWKWNNVKTRIRDWNVFNGLGRTAYRGEKGIPVTMLVFSFRFLQRNGVDNENADKLFYFHAKESQVTAHFKCFAQTQCHFNFLLFFSASWTPSVCRRRIVKPLVFFFRHKSKRMNSEQQVRFVRTLFLQLIKCIALKKGISSDQK